MKGKRKFLRALPRAIILIIVLATFLALLKIGTLKYLGSAVAWHIVLFSILVIIALQVGLLTLFAKLLPRIFIPLSALAILFGLYKLATVRYPWNAEPLNTLLGSMKFTKGIEYLMAIAFLLGFIGFWQLMQRRGKGLLVRIVPVTVLVLGFGTLAYSCISSQATATLTPPTAAAHFRLAPVLVDTYGPASFNHQLHQQILEGNNCIICHHYSSDKYSFPSCSKCHSVSINLEDLDKPDLMHAYHLRCIGCHKDRQVGPVSCTGCHTKASHPPAAIPHSPSMGEGNCLSCHKVGASGPLGMPEDHAAATNGVCLLCHTPQGGEH